MPKIFGLLVLNTFVIFLCCAAQKVKLHTFQKVWKLPQTPSTLVWISTPFIPFWRSQNIYYFVLVWTYVKFDHWRYKIATLYSARVSDNPLSVKIKLFNQPRMKTVGRKFQLGLHVVIELQLLEINDKDKSKKKNFCPLIKIYVNLSMFKFF